MIPVTFSNQQGQKLFGIVHPAQKAINPEKAIIILSPGIKSRVAPHRLYIKMARRFSEMGFTVLRFDFYGLGDSEGEVDAKYVADLYGSIQVGRYVDDTKAAMDWMQSEYKFTKFILAGLCGGAITGLFTGADDDRVDSLIGLGIPVILDTSNVSQFNFITEGQLQKLRKGYIAKLMDPKSWIRFLMFQSDYRMILKSILQPVKKKKKNETENKDQYDKTGKTEKNTDNFNNLFPPAFHHFAGTKKIFLSFSQTDRLYWEFEEKYMFRYAEEYKQISANVHISITKDANHIYSFREWQEDMLDSATHWLETHYQTQLMTG